MNKIKILGISSILVLSGILVGAGNVGAGDCGCPDEPDPVCGCRWTGGGSVFTREGQRVTHGFELHCNVKQVPNNLEINWGGNHFHLEKLDAAVCWMQPGVDPEHPRAGCNYIHAFGEGRLNGISGYHIEFTFSDKGEPGKGDHGDHAEIEIRNQDNTTVVLYVYGNLNSGNHQAHRLTGIDAR